MGDEPVCILAGWGIPHACAAALALVKYPQAEVRSASRRYVAEALTDLARTGDLQRIVIAGVPFSADEDAISQALSKLRRDGCAVEWYAYEPHRPSVALASLASIDLSPSPEAMCERMAKALGLGRTGRAHPILRVCKADGRALPDALREHRELLSAAMSAYRRFQDVEAYPLAIRTVAAGVAIPEPQGRMLAEYRDHGHRELVGGSSHLKDLRRKIDLLGKEGNCRVLITGETGVGKETVAYLIHAKSPRPSEIFIEFNCADFSPQLIESRLFGHEKGAFTGAAESHVGVFELADSGTLFLDEVGELSAEAQAGLLRVLQEGRFYRVGGEEPVSVNVRVIAATNGDLEQRVCDGDFREDLYYRLNAIRLEILPLRERREDIRPIAYSIWAKSALPALTEDQLAVLEAYDWQGNVRELQNVLERARVFGEKDFRRLLTVPVRTAGPSPDDLKSAMRAHVLQVFNRHGGHKTNAARALGISLNTLKKYLR